MANLNFDGSKIEGSSTSFGFIIRDDVGKVLIMGAKKLHDISSILLAKAWGMREDILKLLFY